ncbi:hypothetical protein AX774_g752 [Zancudomyces culisetae]|uniref:Retrotransposon gag domain-containing protein n=1 Tax=Zancudomyces culisetae TaxID=1213189 RepID=A0A1R1PXM3_ZANCU|nr:hypothetical protein AX774_g752 [Zancudomyces culisetae]|eukprot:OMH85693.1 hypothetical protein AX774_g752 [Zancudomyces culisetae]
MMSEKAIKSSAKAVAEKAVETHQEKQRLIQNQASDNTAPTMCNPMILNYKLVEPEIFSTNSNMDPSKWIRRYELCARRNGWKDKDMVDLMELYLEGRALLWFERECSEDNTWSEIKNKFILQFEGPEGELIAWNQLQLLKKTPEEDVEELVSKIEKLFNTAKTFKFHNKSYT